MSKPLFLPDKPDFTPANIPPEYLRAIGQLVVASTFLEMNVQTAIHGMARVDTEYGAAITAHMTGPLRLSVLESLAEITLNNMPALLKLEDFIGEIRDSASRRAGYIHAYWCRNRATNEVYAVRQEARTGLETNITKPPVAAIMLEADATAALGFKLWNFVHQLGLLPELAPRRPRGHKIKRKRKEARKVAQ